MESQLKGLFFSADGFNDVWYQKVTVQEVTILVTMYVRPCGPFKKLTRNVMGGYAPIILQLCFKYAPSIFIVWSNYA